MGECVEAPIEEVETRSSLRGEVGLNNSMYHDGTNSSEQSFAFGFVQSHRSGEQHAAKNEQGFSHRGEELHRIISLHVML